MAITIACPHCSAKGNVPESMLGQSVRCPKCKKTFPIVEETAPQQNVKASAPAPTPPPAPSGFDFDAGPAAPAVQDVGAFPDPYAEREAPAAEEDESPDRPVRSKSSTTAGGFMSFAMFRVFITPMVVVVLFYFLAFLGCVGELVLVAGAVLSRDIVNIAISIIGGAIGYIVGFFVLRIWCEFILVIFRQYETSVEIRDELRKRSAP